MIDWHTHILPAMDDGCRDVNESLILLEKLSCQGVDTVALTPHFNANGEQIDSFLERRAASFDKLLGELPDNAPKLYLGCEVRYYSGISNFPDLNKLRIGESKLILLEMPMSKWSDYIIRELIELSSSNEFKIVLAHIERYLKFQKSDILRMLYELEILVQVNADFFINLATRRKAVSLLNNNAVQLIGSDCHNNTSRPPRLDKALDVIGKRLGGEFINQMYKYGYSILT